MPRISAPTLEQHRAETIDRLIDAWGELVMAKGYDAVSLADVAAHAGLARTAIYNYFPDRESLLFAWTEREVQRAIELMERELAAAGSVAEKLRIMVRLQLEGFATRHLPPGQEVVRFLRPDTYQQFMDHIEPLEKMLAGILREGSESGELADVDTTTTVPMVLACIGAERVPIATRQHDVEEATERVTAFLLRALSPDKPKAKPRKRAKPR